MTQFKNTKEKRTRCLPNNLIQLCPTHTAQTYAIEQLILWHKAIYTHHWSG